MFRINLNSNFPKQLYNDSIYTLGTHNSYIGIHLPHKINTIDINSTKTHLLSFSKKELSLTVKEAIQKRSSDTTFLINDNIINYKSVFRPVQIKQLKTYKLTRMCRMFWLDLIIIIEMKKQNGIIELNGFHYSTTEMPHRDIIVPLLQERFYKDSEGLT